MCLAQLSNFGGGVAKDSDDPAGFTVCVDKCATLNVVVTFPVNCEIGVGFLEIDGLGVPISGKSCSKVVGWVQHPGIASLGRKERQRANGDKADVILSGSVLNVLDLLGEAKLLALHPLFAKSSLDLFTVTSFSKRK